MDIKTLKYFYAVAKSLSFTQAAQTMHVVQPAISMAVKKLEEELGLTLFHRHDRKISLTDEGKVLKKHCVRIFQTLDDANAEMEALRGLSRGEVRVGIPSMLGSYYFPEIFMAFRKAYPTLNISVTEGGAKELQARLEQGELDLTMIVADAPPKNLSTATIIQEEMMVIMASDHPLAHEERITPEQFFAQKLILFRHGYFHRNIVDQLAKTHKLNPSISFETNLIPLIKAMVVEHEGLTTLLTRVIDAEPQLVARPFTPAVSLELAIAWRSNGYLSVANQTFVNFLKTEGKALLHTNTK